VHVASDAMFRWTAWLCLHFVLCDIYSAKRHIFGGCALRRGAMTPKFELGRDFCSVHLAPKFHHPRFTRLEEPPTNPQTNKFRRKHPTFFAMLRRWVHSRNWSHDDKTAFAHLFELEKQWRAKKVN